MLSLTLKKVFSKIICYNISTICNIVKSLLNNLIVWFKLKYVEK